MTARDFVFWCQGLFEIGGVKTLDESQVKVIREHLDWVFKHDIFPTRQPVPESAGPTSLPKLTETQQKTIQQLEDQILGITVRGVSYSPDYVLTC